MGENSLETAIKRLIEKVEHILTVGKQGIANSELSEESILELENQLQNVERFAEDMRAAFNASDQSLAINSAEVLLEQSTDVLLSMHVSGILQEDEYSQFTESVQEIGEMFEQQADPDYA